MYVDSCLENMSDSRLIESSLPSINITTQAASRLELSSLSLEFPMIFSIE